MPNEPAWLTAEDVVALHTAIVSATGEPPQLRDLGLLQSAAARPRQLWTYGETSDVVDLACLLMLAIARNHPFVQGNKRAGFVAGQAFLEFNGYRLAIADTTDLADTMIRTIADPTLDAAWAALIHSHVVPI